jgi:putative Mg2+ transporter-C (MgtC) family protein
MPTELELAGRLGAALVLGGAIGLERELTGQVAGLRTHMSVALGAALFGIVSAYGWSEFDAVRAGTNVQIDVTRVASNIVTGVGFLGGGAILKDGATVRGLTTAASLWVTAAVGLAVALGGYSMAAMTTIMLVFSLILLRGPRGWIRRRFPTAELTKEPQCPSPPTAAER